MRKEIRMCFTKVKNLKQEEIKEALLINAFKLNEGSLLLDPFNGSGTATHEASLMGV